MSQSSAVLYLQHFNEGFSVHVNTNIAGAAAGYFLAFCCPDNVYQK